MAIASFTLCFNGTSCPIVEGQETVAELSKQALSNMETYGQTTGYIPVRLYLEAFGDCSAHTPDGKNGTPAPPSHMGALVRGIATHAYRRQVMFNGAQVDQAFPWDTWWGSTNYATLEGMGAKKPKGSQLPNAWRSWGSDELEVMLGTELWAIAEHGACIIRDALMRYGDANTRINILGHSRGGVTTWVCAYYLYAYGIVRDKRVNICALDPVPGPGEWKKFIGQLPANVDRFLGIYAWDNNKAGFTAVVPCPNRSRVNQTGGSELSPDADGWVDGPDPLLYASYRQDPWGSIKPKSNYQLIVTRGGHGTPAGNATPNGLYGKDGDEGKVTAPLLSRALVIQFLGLWGVGNLRGRPTGQTLRGWQDKVQKGAAKYYDKMRSDPTVGYQMKDTWQTLASTTVPSEDDAPDSYPTYYFTDILPPGTVPDHYHASAGGSDKGKVAGAYTLASSVKSGTSSVLGYIGSTGQSAVNLVSELNAVKRGMATVGWVFNVVQQTAAQLLPSSSDDPDEEPIAEISGRAKWRALDTLGKKYFGAH